MPVTRRQRRKRNALASKRRASRFVMVSERIRNVREQRKSQFMSGAKRVEEQTEHDEPHHDVDPVSFVAELSKRMSFFLGDCSRETFHRDTVTCGNQCLILCWMKRNLESCRYGLGLPIRQNEAPLDPNALISYL